MTVTTDSEGGFAARLKVNDPATTGIVAYEGTAWDADKGAGPAAYKVVVPAPPNSQTITAAVTAGELSMTQAGDAVQLSSVDFGAGGAATGALQTVTVKDFRGGPAGWSLTGKVTDFTGPGGAIGAGNLSWTPACTAKAGSPSTCAAAPPDPSAAAAPPSPPPRTAPSRAASSPSTRASPSTSRRSPRPGRTRACSR